MRSKNSDILIEDRDDPRVAAYRFVKDRDLIGRNGLFLAEGELVIRRLIDDSPFGVRSIFLSRTRRRAMEDAILRLPLEVPVYVAEQHVFDTIAGFPMHRGAMAVGDVPAARSAHDLLAPLPPVARVLALDDMTNHDNIGGLFRSASAFGVGGVVLTERCADPLYRKATRVSIGATLVVPFARARTMVEAIECLHAAGFTTLALTPAADAVEILDWMRGMAPARVAVLLGSESAGLSDTALRAATRRVRLGRMIGADSLNVAAAGAIALHAIQSAPVGRRDSSPG